MDPFFWRNLSYGVVFFGTPLVLVGSIGTWHFGRLAEQVAPFRQPIRSASSTVEVVVESADQVNTDYVDRGGLLAFGHGNTALLVTAATESSALQLGGNRVLWRGIFEMDAGDSAVGRTVNLLREAEYVHIKFMLMPKDAHVLEGLAIVTINSAVRVEIQVPEQSVREGRILVRDLEDAFRDFR